MTENETEAKESTLRSLRELKNSPGWSIIMDAIKADVLNAALQMADNPVMTEKEMDFRRGAIAAARNFVNMLDILISQQENDLYLASASKQTLNPLNAMA